MKIVVVGQSYEYKGYVCHSYYRSMCQALIKRGHEVTAARPLNDIEWKDYDLLLNVDSGRDRKGREPFITERVPIKSAVYFIDSHGNPSLHKRLSGNFDHVFFAVLSKAHIFAKHPSAHWSPNFTDLNHFNLAKYTDVEPEYDFGFFGSSGGLDRANPMVEVCKQNGWSYDVRQIGTPWKGMWPRTQDAMANCKFLFNHGQKHDGPNLRVIESMAMGRPLITDVDVADGMGKLFNKGQHYIGYEAYTYGGLEKAMNFVMEFPAEAERIAQTAYEEVRQKHLVGNRIEQILSIVDDNFTTGPCHKEDYE